MDGGTCCSTDGSRAGSSIGSDDRHRQGQRNLLLCNRRCITTTHSDSLDGDWRRAAARKVDWCAAVYSTSGSRRVAAIEGIADGGAAWGISRERHGIAADADDM